MTESVLLKKTLVVSLKGQGQDKLIGGKPPVVN
jgi:hypothetical protein